MKNVKRRFSENINPIVYLDKFSTYLTKNFLNEKLRGHFDGNIVYDYSIIGFKTLPYFKVIVQFEHSTLEKPIIKMIDIPTDIFQEFKKYLENEYEPD